jgi:hypothetical protein
MWANWRNFDFIRQLKLKTQKIVKVKGKSDYELN